MSRRQGNPADSGHPSRDHTLDDTPDVRIIHGDCLEVMAGMEAGSVDLVITSPPYNLGVSSGGGFPSGGKTGKWSGGGLASGYGVHGDDMPIEAYAAWQQEVLRECWRLLSDRGAIFYNHKPRIQNGLLWTPFELNPGLPIRQVIIWQRSGGLNFSPTFYLPTHEWIVVFAKSGFRLKNKGASGVGDVWTFPQEKKSDHPAPFPVELPARILKTVDADVVLDPFAGSGTTLVAAMKAGRKAIGIEINVKYIPMIERRTRAAETPLFSPTPTGEPR
jgi:site-specific DNA-methyltransferase (adenine-specific)